MPAVKTPRKGSLAFYPRVRTKRIYPTITAYSPTDKPKVLGFAGYKASMAHAIIFDNNKGSTTFGQEISIPVTVLECPPLKVIGIRGYQNTIKGLRAITEVMSKDLPKELKRKLTIGKFNTEEKLKLLEGMLARINKIRLLVATQPRFAGVGKKTPEVFEIEVGGKDAKEKLEFAKQILGKDVNPNDVIKEGELVDVVAVTKGKGTVGPVKRFGVKIQNRHAKQKRRHVGAIAAQTPRRVKWTSPMAGQLGLFKRTELNKRVLKIGNGTDVTPKSGITRYGIVKSNYVMLQGSVPGPKKRLVLLRAAYRPSGAKLIVPDVREIVK